MTNISIIFLGLILLNTTIDLFLDILNLQYVKKMGISMKIPQVFKDILSPDKYLKSVEYTLAKAKFGIVNLFYDTGLLIIILFSGILPQFYYFLTNQFLGVTTAGQSALLCLVLFIIGILGIPFDFWQQFVIEEKFGFNKSTVKLWISDKVKGGILSFLIGWLMAFTLLWFVKLYPQNWWAITFFIFIGMQFLMVILYPKLILPLFNKLTPLPEGELRSRLVRLAEKTGFHAKSIEVIDGSKRSGHSNAFFTGFGKFKRIVLFDTLVNQLSIDEIEAVLAHEIGHYRCGHMVKMITMSAVFLLLGLLSLHYLSQWDEFFKAFGFNDMSVYIRIPVAFLLFSLLMPVISFWLTPAVAYFSRKNEYEADAFAAKVIDNKQHMINALKKLHAENLSNSTPHPLYSAFHYSHPTVVERAEAIEKL